MERAFTSLAELRTEIDLLKIKQFHQEELLKDKLSDPSEIFHTVSSFFKKKPSANKSFLQGLLNQDIVTNLARVLLPIVLNTTLFKKSGFITKTLVTFLSQKAAKKVDTGAITGLTDKIKQWFVHKKEERDIRKAQRTPDYGIPPDSETY